jgi:hypothetical protein
VRADSSGALAGQQSGFQAVLCQLKERKLGLNHPLPAGCVFPNYLRFSATLSSVSITNLPIFLDDPTHRIDPTQYR